MFQPTNGQPVHDAPPATLCDSFGRVIRDVRMSVTDRCNFRCMYCMPPTGLSWVEKPELLTFEELHQLAEIFVQLGVTRIRLTGGEPLLRQGLPALVGRLAQIPGVSDLALTTNGFLLGDYLPELISAGLNRVTMSLDSLNPTTFWTMTRKAALSKVLENIRRVQQSRLSPLKINCVVMRGVNDHEILDFVNFARETRVAVRFIEYMPLNGPNQWRPEVMISGNEILERIQCQFQLTPVAPTSPSETALRFRFADGGAGEIGIIASVTRPFCHACSRIRLTADGKLKTCLFAHQEYDLRGLLRAGASRSALKELICNAVSHKGPGHTINSPEFLAPARTMSCIGG